MSRSASNQYTLVTTDGFDQDGAHLIRIHVRGGTAIFEIAPSGRGRGHRNAHGCAAVADAIAEGVNRRRLVQTGEPFLVVRAVDLDVVVVTLLEFLHRLL